jgi:tetratricopeptide (TPR) repeat protein
MKEYKAAQNEYEVALRINPADYNTWYNLGELFYSFHDDSATALKYFLKAISYNDAHVKSHFKIGLIFLHNQQFKESIKHLEIARSIEPDDTRILFQLAVAYEKLNLIKEAIAVYNNIIEINPLDKVAKYKLDLITGSQLTS